MNKNKVISLSLIITMSCQTIPTVVFAQSNEVNKNIENSYNINNAKIVEDNKDSRTATYGDVTATFDKNTNIMYINDGVNEYSFSLNNNYDIVAYNDTAIKEESVALHRYEYNKDSSGKYYWRVDIPSYSINPNNWCGWISVKDNGSKESTYASKFADYIDAAKDNEHTIFTYAGATGVGIIVGLITKNPVWSESAFKAACAAAGVMVGYGFLNAASSYYNNLNNARENYFAIRNVLE